MRPMVLLLSVMPTGVCCTQSTHARLAGDHARSSLWELPVWEDVFWWSSAQDQVSWYDYQNSLLATHNSCSTPVTVSKYTHTHTIILRLFWVLSGTTRVSQYQNGKTTKVQPVWIYFAICKSAPHPRQITMPTSHHSVFYRTDALPAAQLTASKHWRY